MLEIDAHLEQWLNRFIPANNGVTARGQVNALLECTGTSHHWRTDAKLYRHNIVLLQFLEAFTVTFRKPARPLAIGFTACHKVSCYRYWPLLKTANIKECICITCFQPIQ